MQGGTTREEKKILGGWLKKRTITTKGGGYPGGSEICGEKESILMREHPWEGKSSQLLSIWRGCGAEKELIGERKVRSSETFLTWARTKGKGKNHALAREKREHQRKEGRGGGGT